MTNWPGVVFDLFGTLVPPFRRNEHALATRECALVLGIDPEQCLKGWVDSFPQRVSGGFSSVADNFAWIVDQANASPRPELCAQAARAYAEFTLASLAPLPGVMETLSVIAGSGRRLGLLTNCAPDVVEIFPRTELGSFFDAAVFSCRDRVVKPARTSYAAVAEQLSVDPSRILYVGDGSDRELTGAREAGMHPVLVTPSLRNTYDNQRPDVAEWTGDRIMTIPDVLTLLDGAR